MKKNLKPLLLFDLDATLTPPLAKMPNNMRDCLIKMKEKFDVAMVGGSDRVKQMKQLGVENELIFTYIFSENGTYTTKGGELFHKNSMAQSLGEENMKKLVNFLLKLMSETDGKFYKK